MIRNLDDDDKKETSAPANVERLNLMKNFMLE